MKSYFHSYGEIVFSKAYNIDPSSPTRLNILSLGLLPTGQFVAILPVPNAERKDANIKFYEKIVGPLSQQGIKHICLAAEDFIPGHAENCVIIFRPAPDKHALTAKEELIVIDELQKLGVITEKEAFEAEKAFDVLPVKGDPMELALLFEDIRELSPDMQQTVRAFVEKIKINQKPDGAQRYIKRIIGNGHGQTH